MRIELRPAGDSDIPFLLELEKTCMRDYAVALWGHWRPSAPAEAYDLSGHYVIECDGVAAGCVAERWLSDHLYLGKLYIDAPFQRRGIGKAVLGMKSREAGAMGLPVKLSVLTTNPADAFYRREGFVVEAETADRRRMSKPAPGAAAHRDVAPRPTRSVPNGQARR